MKNLQINHILILKKAPHCLHLRNGCKMNDTTMVDTMIKDGLTDAFHNLHMGNTGLLNSCIMLE